MTVKQKAFSDMRQCKLDTSLFLYDIWFRDGRMFNGGNHSKKSSKRVKSEADKLGIKG